MTLTLSAGTVQQDFAAGMVRVAPHLLPTNAAWLLQNLMLDDDGSVFKRGGTTAKTDVFDANGLTWCWDGYLLGGQRTVVASATKFGVLDTDDETILNLANGGLSAPARPVVMNGVLFVGTKAYGGSRITTAYSAGTLAVTEGSATVTGTGTSWSTNLSAGSLLAVSGRLVAVQSVDSDTQVTLSKAWTGSTAAGVSYTAGPMQSIPSAMHPSGVYAVAGNRFLSCVNDFAYFSDIDDWNTWDPTDYHRVGGATITGAVSLSDITFLFTTGGVWAISNITYDLTDALGNVQQRLDPVNTDLVLWGSQGVASWQNTLIVPAIDGLWLFGNGAPVKASNAITALWTGYVEGGYTVGQAVVYQGRYILPVLNGTNLIDLLVCRIDRPIKAGRLDTVFPWTTWAGSGADMTAFTVRVGAAVREPVLFGAANTGHLVTYPEFVPDGTPLDHDGSAPIVDLVTRDYATGALNVNLVKWARVRYELIAKTATAVLGALYGSEGRPGLAQWGEVVWGNFQWTAADYPDFAFLDGEAPEDDGANPFKWKVNKKVRYFRFRLVCDDPCDRLVIRSIELAVRPSGRIN